MGNGTISENDLMHKLVQAKKVMNKVDGGDFERGHINEDILKSAPEDVSAQSAPSTRPMAAPSVDKIQQSKLPDYIKKYAKENMKLEIRVEGLQETKYDQWPIEVYSWGMNENN